MNSPTSFQWVWLGAAIIVVFVIFWKYNGKPTAGPEGYYKARRKAGKKAAAYIFVANIILCFQEDSLSFWATLLCFLLLILTFLSVVVFQPITFMDDHEDWEDDRDASKRVRFYLADKYIPINNFLWKKSRFKRLPRVRLFRRLVMFGIVLIVALPWALSLLPSVGGSSTAEDSGAASVGSETSVTQPAPAPAPTMVATPSVVTETSSATPVVDRCDTPDLTLQNSPLNFNPTGIEVCRGQKWEAWGVVVPKEVLLKGTTDAKEAKAHSDFVYCEIKADGVTYFIRTKTFKSAS